MIFVGDEWAEEHHDVYLMDEDGRRLTSRRLPEGLLGIRQLHELIASHVEEPDQVIIGIESDRGLWVGALTAAGYRVFAINPLAAARYRDRHHLSGAKSDASDAKLLADLVRTDRHNHRPIAGDSADAEGIKVLARAHQNLIWTRTRHTNALRNALREYYPAALAAFDDLSHGDALGVLDRAPTPEQGARLPLPALQSALKRGGRQSNIAARARQIPAALRSEHWPHRQRSPPPLPPPPEPPSASSPNSTARSASSRAASRRILKHTRTPTSTSPCQDWVSYSAPGCSVSSGTTRTDTPTPSLAKTTPEPHP
jgi:Transposase